MICKICNAEIDDNSAVCPFCGAAVEGADSNAPAPDTMAFPDPAAAAPAFEDPAASASTYGNPAVSAPVYEEPAASAPAEPNIQDFGLSEPAQPFADPAAQNPAYNASAQNQGFTNPDPGFNSAPQPNAGYGNPDPGFNAAPQNNGYGVPPQQNYGQPAMNSGVQFAGSEYERQADTIQTLGIVALVISLLCNVMCAGSIVGIVGLVKYKGLKDNLYLISESGQKKANTGRILSIISVVLGVLAILGSILYFVLIMVGALSEYSSSY